jgi:hypothetical protein
MYELSDKTQKSFYADRAASGDFCYRIASVNTDASAEQS